MGKIKHTTLGYQWDKPA